MRTLGLVLMLLSSSAWSERDPAWRPQHYDFDDDTVEADPVRPDGDVVDTRGAARHTSLIRVRRDFYPEMMRATDAL